MFQNLTGFNTYYNLLKSKDDDATSLSEFLNQAVTRRAIHVGNNLFQNSDGANKVEDYLKHDFMDSVADWISELLSHYSVLIYNGQLDIIIAYPLTENFLKKLNFSASDEYKIANRLIWRVDDDVAGYVKRAGNLTEILVRNAGMLNLLNNFFNFSDFFFKI